MVLNEQEFKQHLKSEQPARVYVLYGEESYLTSHYAEQLIRMAGGRSGDPLAEFNFQKFDGQECPFDIIEEAVESLPLMADRKCVVVQNCDVASAAIFDRALALVADPPEETVLIFWMSAVFNEGKNPRVLNSFWMRWTRWASVSNFPAKAPRISYGCFVPVRVAAVA